MQVRVLPLLPDDKLFGGDMGQEDTTTETAEWACDRRGYRKTGRTNRKREKPVRTLVLEIVLAEPDKEHQTKNCITKLTPPGEDWTTNVYVALRILVREGFLTRVAQSKYAATGKTLLLAWFHRNSTRRVSQAELMTELGMEQDESDDIKTLLDTLVSEQEIFFRDGQYRLSLVDRT